MGTIHETRAKTLLRSQKRIDSWFLSRYGMNLYRGCEHNCTYCDGRAEKYHVEGTFGQDITVKTNAIDLLQQELARILKPGPWNQGFIMVGGGVGDSYQPAEEQYLLTRKTLELLRDQQLPVHILTKSTMVTRDIDLLQEINTETQALVCMSFSSCDDHISSLFEPGVPPPSKRVEALKECKQAGLPIGMFLMPVIPFVTDTVPVMEQTLQSALKIGVDFLIFSGMTLKEGRQKTYFSNVLKHHYPELIPAYETIYTGDKWGNATSSYYQSLHETFHTLLQQYPLPPRIPLRFFHNIISDSDKVIVLLEHLHYLLQLQGKKSPYGYAAFSFSKQNEALSEIRDFQSIKGVGPTTERIIKEILETGTSSYYEQLFSSYMRKAVV